MRLRRLSARSSVPTTVAALAVAICAGVAGASSTAGADETVAFAGMHWGTNLQGGASQIYVVHADGSGLKRLSRAGPWTDTSPAWRLDGRKVAYGRLAHGAWRLYVMDSSGARAHAITSGFALADSPTWSPDGRSIAFEGLPLRLPPTGSFAQQIYVAAASGHGLRRLTSFATFKGGAGKPAWSPDGKRILFRGGTSMAGHAVTSIWSVRPNGQGVHRLVLRGTDPAWSLDGSKIAFVRGGDVYTARADGSVLRRVTRLRTEIKRPSWSPDGTRIAFSIVHRAKNQAYDTQRIWVVRADGTGLHAITASRPRFWTGAPAWRPAGD